MIDSQSLIQITVRAPENIAKFAHFVGNEGVLVLLEMRLRLQAAVDMAGKDDVGSFMNLLELHYLSDVVSDFCDAKTELEIEAARINTDHMAEQA